MTKKSKIKGIIEAKKNNSRNCPYCSSTNTAQYTNYSPNPSAPPSRRKQYQKVRKCHNCGKVEI